MRIKSERARDTLGFSIYLCALPCLPSNSRPFKSFVDAVTYRRGILAVAVNSEVLLVFRSFASGVEILELVGTIIAASSVECIAEVWFECNSVSILVLDDREGVHSNGQSSHEACDNSDDQR